MKAFIHYIISRPIGVFMTLLLVLILSSIAAFHVPISLFPDLDVPHVTVVIENEERNASEFENATVQHFRNYLLQVPGVENIYSVTSAQEAKIELKFSHGTQMDFALLNVNEKIDQALPTLTKAVRPIVTKRSLADYPTLYLAVLPSKKSNLTKAQFAETSQYIAHNLKNQLEQLESIGLADVTGTAKSYYQILVNQDRLQSLNLTIQEVTNTLDRNNQPIGTIALQEGNYVFDLALNSEIETIDDILDLQLTFEHKLIRLRELIIIKRRTYHENIYLYNGEPAISIALVKKAEASYTQFTRQVNQVLTNAGSQLEGVSFHITDDQSSILKTTINSLVSSLGLGLFFALLSTLIFIRSFRVGILLLAATVCALVISTLLFYVLNLSFNLISLTGLILGVGLMIDNTIIVVDNITQHVEQHQNLSKGISSGVAEVTVPLLTSGFTTCSIFFPLFMLSGLAGVLFLDEALSIAICLGSSFICSITLVPTLYFQLFKNNPPIHKNLLSSWYQRGTNRVNHHFKPITIGLLLITSIGFWVGSCLPAATTPAIQPTSLISKISWNENINNQAAASRITNLFQQLAQTEGRLLKTQAYLGQQDFYSQTERKFVRPFEALLYIDVADANELDHLNAQLSKLLNSAYPKASTRNLPQESVLKRLLNEEEYDLEIITQNQFHQQKLVAFLQTEFPETGLDYLTLQEGYELVLNENQLINYHVNKRNLLSFIQYTLGGNKLLNIQEGPQNIPVLYSKGLEKAALLNIDYQTSKGAWLKLGQLINLLPKAVPQGIEIIDNQQGYITRVKTNAYSATEIIDRIAANEELANGLRFTGHFEQVKGLQKKSLLILVVIIVLLYLILAIQFDAFLLPLIVLFEVPVCIAISMIALYATQQSLNIMSLIGMLMMAGIIINDSILKIDLINKLHRSGKSLDESIHLAGKRRLSSIIMTSLTTIMAVSPFIVKNDIGAQLQTPLIIPIIAGLSIGTLISIFFVPLLYKKLSLCSR